MTCGRILKSVAAGRILYDPANGAACLSALAAGALTAADCEAGQSSLQPGAALWLALVPQVPLGGACSTITPDTAAIECADGGYCDEGGVSYSCAEHMSAVFGRGRVLRVEWATVQTRNYVQCRHT